MFRLLILLIYCEQKAIRQTSNIKNKYGEVTSRDKSPPNMWESIYVMTLWDYFMKEFISDILKIGIILKDNLELSEYREITKWKERTIKKDL